MTELESVLFAALRLPVKARAAVVAELLDSLDADEQPAEEVEAAWANEIQRRLGEVDAGTVTPIPWTEARRRIAAAATGRRETP